MDTYGKFDNLFWPVRQGWSADWAPTDLQNGPTNGGLASTPLQSQQMQRRRDWGPRYVTFHTKRGEYKSRGSPVLCKSSLHWHSKNKESTPLDTNTQNLYFISTSAIINSAHITKISGHKRAHTRRKSTFKCNRCLISKSRAARLRPVRKLCPPLV